MILPEVDRVRRVLLLWLEFAMLVKEDIEGALAGERALMVDAL